MKTMLAVLTRRDRCYLVGRRAQRLNPAEAAAAWAFLANKVEAMGDLDVPKFIDLFCAFHAAAITAKRIQHQRAPSKPKPTS
jgi:hypothetical protein